MRKINTIFWDLDGTLVNTDDLYDQTIKFACSKTGCVMKRKIEEIPNGKTLIEDFIFLIDNEDPKLLEQLKNYAFLYFKANFDDNLVIKNSLKLFNYFHSLGLQQSIVSNSNQELCNFMVKKIGIENKCSHYFGTEAVKHSKPNPELYLHALKTHSITDESQCLSFEDSATGINSAKAANLTVIGVGSKSSEANPDHIWDIEAESDLMFFDVLSKSYQFM